MDVDWAGSKSILLRSVALIVPIETLHHQTERFAKMPKELNGFQYKFEQTYYRDIRRGEIIN